MSEDRTERDARPSSDDRPPDWHTQTGATHTHGSEGLSAQRRGIPPRKIGPYLISCAQAHGLIIRALGDRIGFSPPLVITGEQIDDMYARFARALDETWEWVQREDGAAQ